MAEDTAGRQKESLEIEELIGAIEITDHTSLQEAVSYIAEIKKQHKGIEEKRKSISQPLTKATKELNALFKGPVEPLVRAETALKNKIGRYTFDCYAKRTECLEKSSGVMEATAKQAIIKEAEGYILPKIAGLAISDFWGGDVLDPEAIKKWAIENNRMELLLINGKVLEAITKTAGADPKIPGWHAERKIGIAITVAKVK